MAKHHLSAVATVGESAPPLDQVAAALRRFRVEGAVPFGDFGKIEGAEQYLRSIRGMTSALETGFRDDGEVAALNPAIVSAALEGIGLLAAMASASIAAQEAIADATQ